jgi:hypothetical protein
MGKSHGLPQTALDAATAATALISVNASPGAALRAILSSNNHNH